VEKGRGQGRAHSGRWSEGKSGRGEREETKKESRARGESASARARMNNDAQPSHESLNAGTSTATRPDSVS